MKFFDMAEADEQKGNMDSAQINAFVGMQILQSIIPQQGQGNAERPGQGPPAAGGMTDGSDSAGPTSARSPTISAFASSSARLGGAIVDLTVPSVSRPVVGAGPYRLMPRTTQGSPTAFRSRWWYDLTRFMKSNASLLSLRAY